MMTALGVLPEVAERCLNHLEENNIKRTYQRHSYHLEMADAWCLLGQRIETLVYGTEIIPNQVPKTDDLSAMPNEM
jgi:hypothetical protein